MEWSAAALPQLAAVGSLVQDRDERQKIYSPVQPERTDRRTAQITLTQPLFTWGQVSAAIRAATAGLKSADEQLRLYRQAAQRDVSAAFYDVLLARELHGLALHNLDQKRRHLEEARRKHQAGVATDYDVLAAEVSVENARPEVIRTENQIRTSRERLRFLLAMPEEVDAQGILDAVPSPVRGFEEAFAWPGSGVRIWPICAIGSGSARSRSSSPAPNDKPRVDFKGSYGWSYLEQPNIYGDGPTWSVGVQLSYPFFDGLRARGKVAQAERDLKRLRLDEAKQTDAVALEVRNANNAVGESQEILKALSGTVAQAERLLAMAEQGFVLGVKTRLDVEDAELNLRQAKSSLNQARRDYLVARVNLDWVSGVLGE